MYIAKDLKALLKMKSIIFKESPQILIFEQKNQKKTLSSEEMVRRKIIWNDQL